jgi:hypothetical protein
MRERIGTQEQNGRSIGGTQYAVLAAAVLLLTGASCLGQPFPIEPFGLTEPNGGEIYGIGGTMTIRWRPGYIFVADSVTIQLYRDGIFTNVIATNTDNDGEHSWTVTGPASTHCRIRLVPSSGSADMSAGDFTIQPMVKPTVTTLSATQGSCGSVMLRGRLDNDGGEPCRVMFVYSGGETGSPVPLPFITPWQEGVRTGQTFTETVTIGPGAHIECRAVAENSAGSSGGGNVVIFDAPDGVEVPDLANMTKSEAQASLQTVGLVLGMVAGDPLGRVANQSPRAGTEVCPGSAVDITLTLRQAKVPNVIGMSESNAKATLEAAGFAVNIWYGPSTMPKGTVFRQDPLGGTMVLESSDVAVTLSQGDDTGPGPGPGPGGSTVPLLVDGDFEASSDSAVLRANSLGQDWYESRQDVPTLLSLDLTNVGGNATKKAKLTPGPTGSAYLTQELSAPQTCLFVAQWDIYVDSILDRPGSSYDRAAWVFIGDDTGTTPGRTGPNAEDSERFVYLGFYKAGGGASGTMDLVAREGSTTATTFATVATGLSLKRWYTVTVICDLVQSTYDVCVDGQFKKTVKARTSKSNVTHISFAQWTQDEGAATFYVDNVTAEVDLAPACGPLLVDCDFSASPDSTALRTNSPGQDWYESRQDVPMLLTLDYTNVGGNATKKARLTASTVGNAYLTQEFRVPQTQRFMAQWDIYVDSILDRPSSSYDRAAWMFIGDDTGTTPDRTGPNAEDSERFVYLGFYKAGGGTSGTMDLVAREGLVTGTTFTAVATGLSLKRWYTITVICDVARSVYDVYVDGEPQRTVMARTPKSSLTHISLAEWPQDEGAATFYVDNVTAECIQ